MLGYFFRRAMISLNQRKIWFLLPILLSVIFAGWLYFSSPRVYNIGMSYLPPNALPGAGNQINPLGLWNDTIDAMPLGNQFINSKVREISKNRKIVQAWTEDSQNSEKVILARRSGGIGRFIVNDIKDHFSINEVPGEGEETPGLIRFTYEGTNRALGDQLVAFYSQSLIDTWQGELKGKLKRERMILDRLSALSGDDDEDEEDDEPVTISPAVQKKIEQRQANVNRIEMQLALLAGRFSSIERVELERKLSDGIVVRSLLFLILVSLVTLVILVGVEFFSKSFTTELQVSQYLGIRLIGTIPKIDPMES